MNAKQIKNELKSIGITEAIGKSIIYNGKEAVLLNWNNKEEVVEGKPALTDNEDYRNHLAALWSDDKLITKMKAIEQAIEELVTASERFGKFIQLDDMGYMCDRPKESVDALKNKLIKMIKQEVEHGQETS